MLQSNMLQEFVKHLLPRINIVEVRAESTLYCFVVQSDLVLIRICQRVHHLAFFVSHLLKCDRTPDIVKVNDTALQNLTGRSTKRSCDSFD